MHREKLPLTEEPSAPWLSSGEGKTGICPLLKIETKKQRFLENLKSAA